MNKSALYPGKGLPIYSCFPVWAIPMGIQDHGGVGTWLLLGNPFGIIILIYHFLRDSLFFYFIVLNYMLISQNSFSAVIKKFFQ
jgi:hypothetical protein